MTNVSILNLKSLHIHVNEPPHGLIAGELLAMASLVDAPRTKVLSKDGKTVYDPATGLTWEQAGSDKKMDYDDVDTYIAKLNAEKFGGISTWRRNDDKEGESLIDRSHRKPAIDPIFSCKSDLYWTSKPLMNEDGTESSVCVWIVNFGLGDVDYDLRDYKAFCRAVSGPLPAGQ